MFMKININECTSINKIETLNYTQTETKTTI